MQSLRRIKHWILDFATALFITLAVVAIITRIYIDSVERRHSNRNIGIDENGFFGVAYIKCGNFEAERVDVKEWRELDYGAMKITATNGVVYFTSIDNVVLISDD